MISRLGRIGLLSLSVSLVAAEPHAVLDPCDAFYQDLLVVPHVSLTVAADGFTSIWDGESYAGCEIEFKTNDSIRSGVAAPSFFADPGTALYDDGWRMRVDIGADGAGSGVHGIQRDAVLCIIRWEQAAYIDDDGTFVESETLRMWIQCREMGAGRRRSTA